MEEENALIPKLNLCFRELSDLQPLSESSVETETIFKENLTNKYDSCFHFFLSKPINEIVFELSSHQVTLAFNDVRTFSEEAEYLKRTYKHQTADGSQQISDRIKMLGQFYGTYDKFLKYEYPMMVITNTREIFQKRRRRLKKISVGEGSSDDTGDEQFSDHYNMNSSENECFLKDLSKAESLLLKSKGLNYEGNEVCSFESSAYDIFSGEKSEHSENLNSRNHQVENDYVQNASKHSKFSPPVNQEDIQHLICDFKAVDQTQSHQDRYYKQKDLLERPLTELKNLKSIQVEDGDISGKNKKKHFLGSYLHLLENRHRRLFAHDFSSSTYESLKQIQTVGSRDDGQQTGTQAKYQLSRIDDLIRKEKAERSENRRKIREKAEELLKRVKTEASSLIRTEVESMPNNIGHSQESKS